MRTLYEDKGSKDNWEQDIKTKEHFHTQKVLEILKGGEILKRYASLLVKIRDKHITLAASYLEFCPF